MRRTLPRDAPRSASSRSTNYLLRATVSCTRSSQWFAGAPCATSVGMADSTIRTAIADEAPVLAACYRGFITRRQTLGPRLRRSRVWGPTGVKRGDRRPEHDRDRLHDGIHSRSSTAALRFSTADQAARKPTVELAMVAKADSLCA
jgi:hypothetical protein